MTATVPRLDVTPSRVATDLWLSLRPHFIHHIGIDGPSYVDKRATRWGAVRAARKAARPEGLWVHVLDDSTPQPRTIRTIPTGSRR